MQFSNPLCWKETLNRNSIVHPSIYRYTEGILCLLLILNTPSRQNPQTAQELLRRVSHVRDTASSCGTRCGRHFTVDRAVTNIRLTMLQPRETLRKLLQETSGNEVTSCYRSERLSFSRTATHWNRHSKPLSLSFWVWMMRKEVVVPCFKILF
jgi:hypothetical protein